jgi:hypothetical protein
MKKLFLQLALCMALTSMSSAVINATEAMDSQMDSSTDNDSTSCIQPFAFMSLGLGYQAVNTSYTDLVSKNTAPQYLGNPVNTTLINPNYGTGQSLALTNSSETDKFTSNGFLGQLACGYVVPVASRSALIFKGFFGLGTPKKKLEVTRTYTQVNADFTAGAQATELLTGNFLSNINFGVEFGAGIFFTPKTLMSFTVGYIGQRQSTPKSGCNADNVKFDANTGYCLNGLKLSLGMEQFVSDRMAIGIEGSYAMFANRSDSVIYSFENAYEVVGTDQTTNIGQSKFEQTLVAPSLSNNSFTVLLTTKFMFSDH